MPNLDNGTANITITKQTGTNIHLPTQNKFVDTDIDINLDVQEAVAHSDTAAADVNVNITDGASGGINVGSIIGNKTTSEPNSGFYLRMDATGSGGSQITTSGWIESGSLEQASAAETKYFAVQEATASVSGSNVVTPTVVTAGSNVTLSDTNNGVAVTATGGGTANAQVSVNSGTAGYVPGSTEISSANIEASNSTTSETKYISGVNLVASNGKTNVFTATVPNGAGTQTLTFSVASNGDVTIT